MGTSTRNNNLHEYRRWYIALGTMKSYLHAVMQMQFHRRAYILCARGGRRQVRRVRWCPSLCLVHSTKTTHILNQEPTISHDVPCDGGPADPLRVDNFISLRVLIFDIIKDKSSNSFGDMPEVYSN